MSDDSVQAILPVLRIQISIISKDPDPNRHKKLIGSGSYQMMDLDKKNMENRK